MRIAVLSHLKHPIAEPFAGGLEAQTHLLVRHLQARGHRVTLFAAAGSDPVCDLQAICTPTGTPATLQEAAVTARVEHAAYARIVGRLERGGFDLVHNNSLHYLPLDRADRIPAAMVTTLHCPPFEELEAAAAAPPQRPLRFVAVSAAMRRLWQPIVPVTDTIPNGIDLGLFRARLEPPAMPRAVWSGRLVPEKGLHLAIAAARLARMPLRILGPIEDRAYWEGFVAPALGGDIVYVGHLGHPELVQEVARASVSLVTPCWEEAYGLVVAEALACGTPVAGFARGALPDLLDARTGRLVPADDVEALARAIPAAAALSRSACRSRAEAQCDAAVMVDRYERLYHDEIARFHGGRTRAAVPAMAGLG
ncbi:glycosyltransferase [Paeniroseomonas aquatica]|uniref:Glycosyltransferase n=1 Tax=Paeniroseomonas aquatica TaxID=373043 RepID=A0ABT8A8F5_9PROT|nr:glycosyltransferase [Paeniroseomonas aquatica]MDN3565975.1 glycosyltransferase [Paeniroseomonas aquatica]